MNKKKRTTLLISLLALSSSLSLHAQDDWKKCPSPLNARNLEKWRNSLISEVMKRNYAQVEDAVKECFPDRRPTCYEDLLHYVSKKQRGNPPFNFYRDDLTVKSELDLPSELLARDRNGNIIPGAIEIPKNIKKIAQQKNWPNVLYKTRSTGGFDHSPNLFILAMTSPEKDIILQTSPHPDGKEDPKNPIPNPSNGDFTNALSTLTLITIDKTKSPPVGQMRLMRRELTTATDRVVYRWNNETAIPNISGDACIKCHTTPLRPISPLGYRKTNTELENKLSPEQSGQVDAVNSVLEQYSSWGSMKWNGNEYRLGPPVEDHPLGWAPAGSHTRQEEFLRRCASRPTTHSNGSLNHYYKKVLVQKTPPDINYQKLSEALNCVECHNNNKRGILHESYSPNEVKFKIMIDKSMPHNIELNDDERIALFNCLYEERIELFSQWKNEGEWMKSQSCFGDQWKGLGAPRIESGPSNSSQNSSNASGQ